MRRDAPIGRGRRRSYPGRGWPGTPTSAGTQGYLPMTSARCAALPLLTALILAAVPYAARAEDQRAQESPDSRQPAAESAPANRSETTHSVPATALGADEDIHLFDLEIPVVVSVMRRPQTVEELPYAITVITAQDIRRAGARTVADALRLAPGVDVAELNISNAAVSPRGAHGFLTAETLVLVDGRQIFDALFGGTLWGSWPFQLEDIERIEVIRGPAGVTWGANAMNGVINIVTKDPRDQRGLTFRAMGGFPGMHEEYLGYGFADEKLRLRASGSYFGSDGFQRGGSLLRPLDDYARQGKASLHGIITLNETDSLLLSGGSAIKDGGFPPALTGGLRTSSQKSSANFLLSRWTRRLSADETIDVTFFVNDFHAKPGVPQIDYRYQQIGLQFGHTFKPHHRHTLSWGLDARWDLMDFTLADPFMATRGHVSSGEFTLYVSDDWRLSDRWTLHLAGALGYDTYGGFSPTGRAALSYRISPQSFIYGSVSRAFAMPPSAVRFVDIPLAGGLAHLRASDGLREQELIAYELGYRRRMLDDKLSFAVTGFWHQTDNLITISPRLRPGAGPGLRRPYLLRMDVGNRVSESLYGVEVETKYDITPRLQLVGNYTYQVTANRSAVPAHEHDQMTPPQHKLMLGPRWSPTDDLHLSATAYWVDAVRAPNPTFPLVDRGIPSYWRLDLRGEYEFWNKRASVAVGVRNLLDSHHPEGTTIMLNNAEVPRMVYGELRIRFE